MLALAGLAFHGLLRCGVAACVVFKRVVRSHAVVDMLARTYTHMCRGGHVREG